MFGIVLWAWNRIQSRLRGHVTCEGLHDWRFAGLRFGCHLLLLPFRIGLRILVRLDALVELYPDNL